MAGIHMEYLIHGKFEKGTLSHIKHIAEHTESNLGVN
jgi:hypothetical protein